MSRALIAIGLLLLLATVPAKVIDPEEDDIEYTLAYNPTYDLWFFYPSGRPKNLTDAIKAAYWEKRPGGVCFQRNEWYYCKSKEKIQ